MLNTRCLFCNGNCDCCSDIKLDQKEEHGPGNLTDQQHNVGINAIVRQFLKLLEKYLISRIGKNKGKLKILEKVFGLFLGKEDPVPSWHFCNGCLKLVQSFNEFYYEMERTELLLNWRLGTLTTKIVKNSKPEQATESIGNPTLETQNIGVSDDATTHEDIAECFKELDRLGREISLKFSY